MNEVGNIIATFLSIYLIVLIGRLVFDFVQIFARDWRPTGVILILVEAIYTVTEPPLKLIRRVVPPIRIGQVSLHHWSAARWIVDKPRSARARGAAT